MILDAYTHILPREYATALLRTMSPDFDFAEIHSRGGFEQFTDIDERLRHMDWFKVDMQLLGLPYPVPELNSRLCRLSNDAIAEVVQKRPDRFQGIGSIPLKKDNIEEALDELDRIIRDLGLKGVLIPCELPGLSYDDETLKPFYDKVVSLDVPLFLMPADPTAYPDLEYGLGRIYGWPFSTTIAAATLVFGGVIEDYPRIKIVLHHLGGMMPFYVGRMEGFAVNPKYQNVMKRKLTKTVTEYARMLYVDTAVCGYTPALECAYAFFGRDHVLFGTDYPMGPKGGVEYLSKIVDSINSSTIPAEDKEKIRWENAARILKLS